MREATGSRDTINMGFRQFIRLFQDLQGLADQLEADPNTGTYSRYISALVGASAWLNENANKDNSIIQEFRAFLQENIRRYISKNLASGQLDKKNPETVRFIQESDQLASLQSWAGDHETARDTLLRVHKLGLSDRSITLALAEDLLKAPFEDKSLQLELITELESKLKNILENEVELDDQVDDLWGTLFIERRRTELSLDAEVLLNPETDPDTFHSRYEKFAVRKAEIESLDYVQSEALLDLIDNYKILFSQVLTAHGDKHSELISIALKAAKDIC